jgi:hypothetical protein
MDSKGWSRTLLIINKVTGARDATMELNLDSIQYA